MPVQKETLEETVNSLVNTTGDSIQYCFSISVYRFWPRNLIKVDPLRKPNGQFSNQVSDYLNFRNSEYRHQFARYFLHI